MAWVLVAACGGDAPRVSLAPIDHGPCGTPAGARIMRIIAYAGSGQDTRTLTLGPGGESIDISNFPGDTEQIGVEVEIGGGIVGTTGKTAPFVFSSLEAGDAMPIFMAPPHGFCPTASPMTIPRAEPLLARAGSGVLVVGGHDNGPPGARIFYDSAEYYDPATATFMPVDVPSVLGAPGFAGAALTTMPDGRVVITGGPKDALTVFDPTTMRFRSPVLIDGRSFHAAVAIGTEEVLLAGGCASVDEVFGTCTGIVRNSSQRYDVDSPLVSSSGPILQAGRIGAQVFDIGVQTDGELGLVIAGGRVGFSPEPTGADLISLGENNSVKVTGAYAQAAALDGGAVLTAFAGDADPMDGRASVIAPGQEDARVIAPAPDLTGMRLVGLEDGRVLAIGDPSGDVIYYNPTIDRWQTVTPPPYGPDPDGSGPAVAPSVPALPAASMIRLPDGSVLVVGSLDGGVASATAWVFRPSLIGPGSDNITVQTGLGDMILTPSDPSTVVRTPDWRLAGTTSPARALVGGPRMSQGAIEATIRIRAGGVGMIAQQVGPGQSVIGELMPGTAARVVQVDSGTSRTICMGQIVDIAVDATAIVRFEIAGDIARLVLDEAEILNCPIDLTARGAWGVAALPDSTVTVDTVVLDR